MARTQVLRYGKIMEMENWSVLMEMRYVFLA